MVKNILAVVLTLMVVFGLVMTGHASTLSELVSKGCAL
jgi:hypothetical protein